MVAFGTEAGIGTGTRKKGAIGVSPVPVQVHYERFHIKPYNPFVYVSVLVPVLVPETASVIKPSHCDPHPFH